MHDDEDMQGELAGHFKKELALVPRSRGLSQKCADSFGLERELRASSLQDQWKRSLRFGDPAHLGSAVDLLNHIP